MELEAILLCVVPSKLHPFTELWIFLNYIANVLWLGFKAIALHPKSYVGGRIQAPSVLSNRGALIVKASSDVNGTDSTSPESPAPPSDSKEKSTPVENLPLQSKIQELEQQRLKMKLAKKIRLRRKRLVRKRHLRKKGRWPPSKMKKNKNV